MSGQLERLLEQATPGPWKAHYPIVAGLYRVPIVIGGDDVQIAKQWRPDDAALAALAPDLARFCLTAVALVKQLDAEIRMEGYLQDDPDVVALLARFAELEQRAGEGQG